MDIQPQPAHGRQAHALASLLSVAAQIGNEPRCTGARHCASTHAPSYDGVTSRLLVHAEGVERLADVADLPLILRDCPPLIERQAPPLLHPDENDIPIRFLDGAASPSR